MADYIIGTDKFKTNLDSWLFRNDQANAEFLAKNKSQIPQIFKNYSKTLYRGMTVDDEFLDKLKSGITLTNHTSWSKNVKLATAFVNDPKYKVGNKTGTRILIQKVIPLSYQILDIDAFFNFMGKPQLLMLGYDEMSINSAMKEQEVLIQKGMKIRLNDIKVI